jgi:hypothetical protein
MTIPKITGAQRDFSAGEIDVSLKRSDEHPARKAGVRQMANWRILNSNTPQNRPGRSALFPISNGCSRIEEVTMSTGNIFKIAFGSSRLQIIDSTGTIVFNRTLEGNGFNALPWISSADIASIVYAVLGQSIYIAFGHLMRPQVVSWDGVSTWSIADYNEQFVGTQKRTPFYRLSPQGITILPSATSGLITINASGPIFTPASINSRIRFVGRQIGIQSFLTPTSCTAFVEEALPGSQQISFSSAAAAVFSLNDEVIGSVTGSKGIVTSVAPTGIVVQLLTQVSSSSTNNFQAGFQKTGLTSNVTSSTFAFTLADTIVGPGGSLPAGSVSAIQAPSACSVWDEEIMNNLRGFPASVFVDQFRLGFCDFPALPGAIAWSAINSQTDLYVGAQPSNAILELVPDKVRVQYVVPGPESNEFIFCDKKIYYIPINPNSPLVPGSVSFQLLSSDGAAHVQPRTAQEIILYAGSGGSSMMAVIATGAYLRPFNTRYISEFHTHLFNGITAIAAQTADGTFAERYIYVLNSNGSVVTGKYTGKKIETDSIVGWGPWSGVGTVNWIAALSADIIFTSSYFGVGNCEILDDTKYLDGALLYNSLPAAFTPPGGKGPLWFIPSQTVTVMDQVTRVLGTYQIDANGFLIAQNAGGEDLTVASLVAGQAWTSTLEPFVPDANPGQSVHQRMFKRRVSRMAVYVMNSSGFLLARLFSGPVGPNQPALGTVMNQRRVTTYNQDDDATKAPFLREEVERWRPLGRYFDPRVAIIKDTPGPLQIAELGIEASI